VREQPWSGPQANPGAGGYFCFAQGCEVKVRNWDGSTCGGGIVVFNLGREFCREHGDMLNEVQRDLPLFMQELHALAMLRLADMMAYEGSRNKAMVPPPPRSPRIAVVEEKIRVLRAMEEMLIGG
jgi:hypothetical protein